MLYDALAVLQRSELVSRMAIEVERYIVELGTEGRLIEMQLEETMLGVSYDRRALIRDYATEDSEGSLDRIVEEISALPHQDVLDFGNLAEILGYDRKLNTLDFPIRPRGYRLLGQVPRLPRLVVQEIVHQFGSLEHALAASDDDLSSVDGVGPARAKEIREGVRRLQGSVHADQYLNT